MTRTLRLLGIFFGFAIALGGESVYAQLSPTTPSALPSVQYIPNHDFDTIDITLKLRFDWEREQAIGTETITVSPLVSELHRVELDAANMTFNSVTLASGRALVFRYDDKRQKLLIDLDRDYRPTEQLKLFIDYHTNGSAQGTGLPGYGKGLTYIKPTPDYPIRPKQIWSQGETEYNHYWFACYDQPNDLTTSEIIATVEKPYLVISNGSLISTKDNGDNTRTFDWRIDEPHAVYLTSIVVGEYVPIEGNFEGIPVTSYVYPSEVEEGRVTTSRLPAMVRFFSEKTGVKYPYAKYAQTVAENFPGGMENISATTQTHGMIHDARAELDASSDTLESHELAHQWFGDYVTCRSWRDIWLNEGFATYFQALWDDHSLGHDDFLYKDVRRNQDLYLGEWGKGKRRPIVTANFSDPNNLFDVYAYSRGGAVLHMLHTFLGEDGWWRSIHHYLTKYAHQPVETEQFRIAIEETTGQPMDWFFDEWIYRMGHPVFELTKSYDGSSKKLILNVKQVQKPDAQSQFPQVAFFRTPVDIEIVTAAGSRVERVNIDAKAEQTFTFNADNEPVIVNFDYGGTLIKELRFEKSTRELTYQLSNDPDVIGRLWALGQLSNRLKDSSTPEPEIKAIATAIGNRVLNDSYWGVRLDSIAVLNERTNISREVLTKAVQDKNPSVRGAAISALGRLNDVSLAPIYRQLLDDRSYQVVRAAAIALGKTKSPDAFDSLMKLTNVSSWHNVIQAFGLRGLTELADKRALEIGLRFARRGQPVALRAESWRLLATVGKGNDEVFSIVSEALKSAFDQRDRTLATAAGGALVTLADRRGIALLDELKERSVADPAFRSGFDRLKDALQKQIAEDNVRKH